MTSTSPRKSRLGPEESLQRFLISSTSRFVGSYETQTFEFHHAWPQFSNRKAMRRFDEGPTSRSAYVLAFETKPIVRQAGTPIPAFDYVADVIIAWLSVLYGKRFDGHGALQQTGIFHLPDLTTFGTTCVPNLPWNSHSPRVDYKIPLNLVEIIRLKPLLDSLEHGFVETSAFSGAARFYARALEAAERDAEVAYLHLITAGEIIANAMYPDFDDSFLDETTRKALERIGKEMQDGDRLVRTIRKRLLQIKKRFVATIEELVDRKFFECSESKEVWAAFKYVGFSAAIGAAYDLRSRYVHTGVSFGKWIEPDALWWLPEVQSGKPLVGDSEMAKILARAPTFIGLERAIRYALMQFAGRLGADITPALESQPIG
jgi:hypothetical protein